MNALTRSHKFNLSFWCQWIGATVAGFVVSLYWIEVGFRPELGVLAGAIGGVIVGTAQWLVLRQQLAVRWWVVASALGWSLVGWSSLGALGWVAPRNLDSLPLRSIYGMVEGMKVGAIIGSVQWVALQRQIPQAWRWIVGSAGSWALGLALGWTIGAVLRLKTGLFLGEVLGLTVAWSAIAVMTGWILVNLLPTEAHQPKS